MLGRQTLFVPPGASFEDPRLVDILSFMATDDSHPLIANHIMVRAMHCSVFKKTYVQFVHMIQRYDGKVSRQAVELFQRFSRELPN